MVVYILCAAAILSAFIWWKRSTKKPSKDSFLIAGIPKGTVVLHQYGPAPYVPSISPFVMKLETYLRATKIPYVNRYDRKPGPKGKIPWIQYNDDVIADSQSIVEFLNTEFKVDLNRKLTNQQKAVGHAVRRMAEEWLYWVLVTFRVMFEEKGTIYRQVGLPSLIIWYMRRMAKPRLFSQGIGRHSRQEVTSMMTDDLNSVDAILGEKNYLFGETTDDVTEFDIALFGQLCQLTWQMPDCGVEEIIQDDYPRLVRYCERMKETFWPDWEERLKKPNTIASSSSSSSSSSPSSLPASKTTNNMTSTETDKESTTTRSTTTSSTNASSFSPSSSSSSSSSASSSSASSSPSTALSNGSNGVPLKSSSTQNGENNHDQTTDLKCTSTGNNLYPNNNDNSYDNTNNNKNNNNNNNNNDNESREIIYSNDKQIITHELQHTPPRKRFTWNRGNNPDKYTCL